MRLTAWFFFYLLGCLLLAAPLTWLLTATGWVTLEPHRVLGRCAQIFALLGLWPFLRHLGLLDRGVLGYGVGRRRILEGAAAGWLVGILILLVLVATLLALGVRVPDAGADWGAVGERALQALIGGLLIGLLEETFFRGALYGGLRRCGSGIAAAATWSALLYAAVHFLKPGALPPGVAFDVRGLASMLVHVFGDALQWRNLDSFVALFAAGILLALVRERTGQLGWCIGVHAGWVLVIQVARRLTDGDAQAPLAWLAGDYDGTIGWLAALWLALLCIVYWLGSGGLAPGRRSGFSSGACG